MKKDSKRQPAVAGAFYPADPEELFETIHRCFTHPLGPGAFPTTKAAAVQTNRTECLVVPHAGFIYSGPVAAHSYKVAFDFFHHQPDSPKSVIVLGPNHYGVGSGVATSAYDYWISPIGEVAVDQMISEELRKNCNLIDIDEISHSQEHSIEVQLPFLQAMSGRKVIWSLIPISLMLQDIVTARQLGQTISKIALDHADRSFLIIASSDLTHYERKEDASRKDTLLLERASELDLTGFYSTLQRHGITSCGYGAVASVMQAARELGKSNGELLKYATSGDVTGDNSSVVGYPAMRFE